MKASLLLILTLKVVMSYSQVISGGGTRYYVYSSVVGQTTSGTLVSLPVSTISQYYFDLGKNNIANKNEDVTKLHHHTRVNERYSNSEFTDGYLIYSSGNQSVRVKLNYDQLFGEMVFLDDDHDTLFISNVDSVSFVRLGKDLYQHHAEKYLKVLAGNNRMTLCSQLQVKKLKRENSAETSKPTYSVLEKENSYFLIDANDDLHRASRRGFLRTFPAHKKQIEVYLQQMARQRTPIKFYHEKDLLSLMRFCESLSFDSAVVSK